MANPAQPPPPPAQDLQDSVVYRKFTGLKNTVDRERLGPDELELAINVDLDDVGQPHRRRGQTLLASGSFSSLFTSDEGIVFGVKNDYLGVIQPNFSFVELQAGFTNVTVVYVQVGANVYFSAGNAGISGVIDTCALTVSPWGSYPDIFLSPVVNPTSTLPEIRGRLLGKPPFATCLAYYNGRIYLAQGKTLWATELYLYNYVDKTKNFLPFEAEITMVGAVTDGLYVGTKEGVWFLSGPFSEMKRVRVMDSGVVPGSMVYIPGELANPPQVGLDQDTPVKVSIMFMTNEGYCGGMDGGTAYNYTEDRVIFPGSVSGAAAFRRQDGVNQYLYVGNSGGTPAANTRIGDYVDAQLVRAGSWHESQDCVRIFDSFTADVVT